MIEEPIKELVEFTSGITTWKGDNVLFPCTPMGVCQIIMSMGTFWNHQANKEDALKGKVVTILNRYVPSSITFTFSHFIPLMSSHHVFEYSTNIT